MQLMMKKFSDNNNNDNNDASKGYSNDGFLIFSTVFKNSKFISINIYF